MSNRGEYSSQKSIRFTSIEELVEATQWWRLFAQTASIHLELSGVDEEHSRLLRLTIDRHMDACGCREGEIGMAFALGLFFLLGLIEPSSIYAAGWTAIVGKGIGVAIIGAMIGKITSIFRARMLMQKAIRELSTSLLRSKLNKEKLCQG